MPTEVAPWDTPAATRVINETAPWDTPSATGVTNAAREVAPWDTPKAAPTGIAPAKNGRGAILSLFPNAEVTDWKRNPASPLGRKNPDSWHNRSSGAVDTRRIPGMSFDDYVSTIKNAGYPIIEARDEYANPSPHATGGHWHVTIGEREGGTPAPAAAPEKAPWGDSPQVAEPAPRRNEMGSLKTVELGPYDAVTRADQTVIGEDMAKEIDYVESLVTTARANKQPYSVVEETLSKRHPAWYKKEKRGLKAFYDTGVINWGADPSAPELNTNVGEDIVVKGVPKSDKEYNEDFLADRAALAQTTSFTGLLGRLEDAIDYQVYGIGKSPEERADAEHLKRSDLEASLANNPIGDAPMDKVLGFVADIAGGVGPDYLLPSGVGRNALQRVVSAPALAAAVDATLQGAENLEGVSDGFDYQRNLMNAAVGGVTQAGIAEPLTVVANRYKETGLSTSTYSNPRVIGVDEPSAAPTSVAPTSKTPRGPVAKKQAAVSEVVAKTTEGWADSPEIVVHGSKGSFTKAEPELAAKLREDGAENKASGFYGEDGRIHVLAYNLKDVDNAKSLVFHEALGHAGLDKKFGKTLDDVLNDLYERNPTLKKEADALGAGRYKDVYTGDTANARLVEEVLAMRSEKGVVSTNILDKFRVAIAPYIRATGLTMKLSNAEVKAILADAHAMITKGTGKGGKVAEARPSGLKYARTTHVSPHDFDNADPENPLGRFDHSKIGSGEGAQVYGWGTYTGEKTRDAYFEKFSRVTGPDKAPKTYEVDTPDSVTKRMVLFNKPLEDNPRVVREAFEEQGISGMTEDARMKIEDENNRLADEVASFYDDHIYPWQEARRAVGGAEYQKVLDRNGVRSGDEIPPEILKEAHAEEARAMQAWANTKENNISSVMREYQALERALDESNLKKANARVLTGEDAYFALSEKLGSDKKASQYLSEKGVPGNKYKDEGSRQGPDDKATYNYVWFNDEGPDAPKIVNKYMLEDDLPQRTVKKFMTAMKGARLLNEKYRADVKADNKEKMKALAKARKSSSGEAGLHTELAALKGKTTRPAIEPFREKFSQKETKALFDLFKNDKKFQWFESLNARIALKKLFDGEVPTKGELDLLGRVLPKDFIKYALQLRTTGTKLSDAFVEGVNIPRALMASVDLSAPFRQGVFLVSRGAFWKNLPDMFRHAWSQEYHDAQMAEIRGRENYPLMKKANLALTELGADVNAREEPFMATTPEKWAGVGRLVKGSNRAYTGFLNQLRADVFDDIVKSGMRRGVDFNADVKGLRDLGSYINDATGRASLGKRLDKHAPLLSAGLFSPRLIASRVKLLTNVINPAWYANTHPYVRAQYFRDLIGFGSFAVAVASLAEFGGADVEWDPRSSDFLKIRDGNLRYDIFGGFSQYLTFAARLAPEIMGGNRTKTLKGEVQKLGGPSSNSRTRGDVAQSFLRNKLAPVPAYLADFLYGENTAGEKFDPRTNTLKLVIPLFLQDLKKGYDAEGYAGVLKVAPAGLGFGASYYDQLPAKYDQLGRDVDTVKDDDPVALELDRLSGLSESGFPLVGWVTKANLPKGPVRDAADPRDIESLQKVSGDYIYADIKAEMETPEWKEMTDEEKVELVNEIEKDQRANAREDLFSDREPPAPETLKSAPWTSNE